MEVLTEAGRKFRRLPEREMTRGEAVGLESVVEFQESDIRD